MDRELAKDIAKICAPFIFVAAVFWATFFYCERDHKRWLDAAVKCAAMCKPHAMHSYEPGECECDNTRMMIVEPKEIEE